MRPARTPSGTIDLWYTTTYVRRPPGQEIDESGIPPAISLPAPASPAEAARELDALVQMAERPAGVAGRAGER